MSERESEAPGASTVRAPVGEVEVTLVERPTTGYRWTLDACSEPVQALGERFEPAGPELPPGAAGAHVFRFKVSRPGVYEVRFELRRAWEREAARRHVVRLVIEK